MSGTIPETSYRVYYFSPSLITSWRKARDKQHITNLSFVTSACDKYLPSVVRDLQAVGMTGRSEERAPVRLAVPTSILADLGKAAEQTGVSATCLLGICLSRASVVKRSRKRQMSERRTGQ